MPSNDASYHVFPEYEYESQSVPLNDPSTNCPSITESCYDGSSVGTESNPQSLSNSELLIFSTSLCDTRYRFMSILHSLRYLKRSLAVVMSFPCETSLSAVHKYKVYILEVQDTRCHYIHLFCIVLQTQNHSVQFRSVFNTVQLLFGHIFTLYLPL
jgi:hypothetical protein